MFTHTSTVSPAPMLGMITGEKKSFGFGVSTRIEGKPGSIHVKLLTLEYTETVAEEYPLLVTMHFNDTVLDGGDE